MSARGFLFEGSVYMARFVAGVPGPLVGPLEGVKFEMKPNVDTKDLVSRGRGTMGQILESVPILKPTDFSITLVEGSPEVLALALMGTVAALSQVSGSLTAVTVVGVADTWVALTKANLTGVATVTNAAASSTYVENTDYLINRELGLFKVLGTGAIGAAAATLKLTSAYGAITGSTISGSTQPDLRVRMVLSGINKVDNTNCIVTVFEAVIAADAAVDFLSGDFVNMPLKGRMKTPAGFLTPYTVDLRTAG